MRSLFFILISICLSASAQEQIIQSDTHTLLGKLKYDANYPLYTSDAARFGFDQVDEALDKVFSANLPVVFFIHGRGNEPNKSINGGTFVEGAAVRKLETQYNAKVLMFNWNSKAFLYDRTEPLRQMPAAAEALKRVLAKMKTYFAKSENQNKKITLIAHSMGSIVLQTYTQQYTWQNEGKPIFSQILLTSPDADNIKHWQWLNEIAQAETVFVTINKDDDILEKSNDQREAGNLPLGLSPVLPLATKAIYLDISQLGSKPSQPIGTHEVFNKENMKYQEHYCGILDQIIKGHAPDLETTTVESDESNYLKVKFSIEKNSKCFVY